MVRQVEEQNFHADLKLSLPDFSVRPIFFLTLLTFKVNLIINFDFHQVTNFSPSAPCATKLRIPDILVVTPSANARFNGFFDFRIEKAVK